MNKKESEERIVCRDESNIKLDIDKKLLFENQIVPIWVNTKIAASILGITPNALRIRKCRGEVECKYFGSKLRFNVSYLHTLFYERKV